MPRALTDSARASSASSSNSRRGWLGLGRISSVAISRRPVSSRALVERIAASPRPIPRPPPSPLAVSATCSHLFRKLQVGHGARAARVVADDGESVARRLAHADVAGDDGVEYEFGEVLADLPLDVLGEAGGPRLAGQHPARGGGGRGDLSPGQGERGGKGGEG